MSSILEYINSWWYPDTQDTKESKKCLISEEQLIQVKLKPVQDVIAAPARNMLPMDKFKLTMLNKAHLDAILNVKLKKTDTSFLLIKKEFKPRHPVLNELLQKTLKLD
jgi:hypothetical protein